jgi:hypothetical protein
MDGKDGFDTNVGTLVHEPHPGETVYELAVTYGDA